MNEMQNIYPWKITHLLRMAMAAVLLQEWLHELAAISQEYSRLVIIPSLPLFHIFSFFSLILDCSLSA